jgi:small-conductance mechanosensitive channel
MGRDPLFGFLVFVAAVIISRVIMERALKPLSSDEKARLVDAFSGQRIYRYVVMFALMIAYFVVTRFAPQLYAISSLIFIIALMVVTTILSAFSYRKLKSLNLPSDYIRSYLISLAIQYMGIGILVAPFVASYT